VRVPGFRTGWLSFLAPIYQHTFLRILGVKVSQRDEFKIRRDPRDIRNIPFCGVKIPELAGKIGIK
jgi:hypothetical protein